MTTQADYDPAQWETLQFAPLWILSWIGGADATIDQGELEALLKELQEAALYTTPLVREVLFSVANEFEDLMNRYQSDTRSADQGLSHVADVLDQHSSTDEAQGFKVAMIGIGVEIAKASEAVLGRPISVEEEGALAFAAAALRVEPQ